MVLRGKTCFLLVITSAIINAQSISDSLNAFTIDLLTTTSQYPDCPRNLVLSPYTVWTLLSIMDEGAQGETARQLERVLRIPGISGKDDFRKQFKNMTNILSIKDEGADLNVYSSIFFAIKHKLKASFRDVAQRHYDANIQPIDFSNQVAASDKINKYISQATNYRINDFIKPSDLDFALVFLASTLYFKGTWMSPFNRSLTQTDTFYDEKQNKLGEVSMMHQMTSVPYARLDWLKGYAIELPYGKGDKMSMIFMLPYKDQTIQETLELMTQHPFSRITDKLLKASIDFEGEDVDVYLPKFKVVSDLALNSILEKMGATDIFDADSADLLGMFPHYLYISRLLQRAEIEVNEEGTVASAATGASVVNKIPPPKFMANKPFLFFIMNKPTRTILFTGKVTVPPLVPS